MRGSGGSLVRGSGGSLVRGVYSGSLVGESGEGSLVRV